MYQYKCKSEKGLKESRHFLHKTKWENQSSLSKLTSFCEIDYTNTVYREKKIKAKFKPLRARGTPGEGGYLDAKKKWRLWFLKFYEENGGVIFEFSSWSKIVLRILNDFLHYKP